MPVDPRRFDLASLRIFAVAFSALLAPTLGQTQDYPVKPITVIVSYSAGGNNDLRARQLAIPVSNLLGKQVITDNRPGASGNIGHAAVANAAPDGYTLGIGAMGPLAVNGALYPNMRFDAKSFTPIVLIERAPLVLVTRTDKPYKSLSDIVAAAKARPGAIAVGNAGPGGAHHLAAKAFEQTAGIELLHIPYKGGGPAATALLGGEIEMMFEQTYAALPSIQGGKTRALAVTSEKQLPSLPNVPTMAELGYPQATISNWLGLIAPKGTPRGVVQKLNDVYNKALAMPDLREKIEGPGNEVGGGTPEAFATFMEKEADRWQRLVKSAGIKME
jgi:tripartite-type tricarboxylate transporter receptor subunit TctC